MENEQQSPQLATNELANIPLDHHWFQKLVSNFEIIQEALTALLTLKSELETDANTRFTNQDKVITEKLAEQADQLTARINRIIMGTDSESITKVVNNILSQGNSGSSLSLPQYPFKALVSSFSGQNYASLDLYWTSDYQRFYPLNKSVIKGTTTDGMRDPSITFVDGKYYVTSTAWQVYYSSDLIKFDAIPMPKVPNTSIEWAPEWVVAGDDTYIFCCAGNHNTYDNLADMQIYYCKFDSAKLSFSKWQLLDYEVPTGVRANIDPTVAYFNGEWYLAMKLEYQLGTVDYAPYIQLLKSDSVLGPYKYVTKLPFVADDQSLDVEGPSLCVDNGLLYCYADGFRNTTSYRLQSVDGINWNNLTTIGASDGSRMQHFTVMPTHSTQEQQIIQQAAMYYLPEAMGNGVSNYRLSLPEQFLRAGVNELYPEPGQEMYYHVGTDVPNGSVVQVNLHMDKNRFYSKIRFTIENGSTDIRLRLNKTDAFVPPYGLDYYETSASDSSLVLVAKGSSDWNHNLSEPYRLESVPITRVGGRNYALNMITSQTYTGTGNLTGQVVAHYALSTHTNATMLAGTIVRISMDLTVANPDSGQLYAGFRGGGTWTYKALNLAMVAGTKHVSYVWQLNRQLTNADELIVTVDNSTAKVTVSDPMFELGMIEHDAIPAPEDK